MIRLYLSDHIYFLHHKKNLKVPSSNEVIAYETKFGEHKIQLITSINFISSNDSDETRSMLRKRDNIETMIGRETDNIIEEICKSLSQKYQERLEESMRGSNFYFDSVDLLYCHLQKTSLSRNGSSHIDSPKWLQNKKMMIIIAFSKL